CGVCNGPGKVYACGCTEIPDGKCDCDGNILDACDLCGGEIQNPEDCSLSNDIEIPMDYMDIFAYPNPFNSQIHLVMDCYQCSPGQVEILSVLGSRIESFTLNKPKTASRHFFQWNADKTHSGIYFVKVSTPTETMMKKITLLK
ncbi:MAG: T9SS type A sorting domain-containing protein, partial [Candidatus Marinimicrobia bacterium]|nr:T9SS type A sorting domain-containing protein [Candidatus Neomarinimicrobiota bacterium]